MSICKSAFQNVQNISPQYLDSLYLMGLASWAIRTGTTEASDCSHWAHPNKHI